MQLDRLSEFFPDGGAVAIAQNGSVIFANNGTKIVKLDAQGESLDTSDPETYFKC